MTIGNLQEKFNSFVTKYFLEGNDFISFAVYFFSSVFGLIFRLISGQKLNQNQEQALANLDENASFKDKLLVKYRRIIGVFIPFAFFQFCWWCLAVKHDFFSLFPDRYVLSITMIFGATIAGKFDGTLDFYNHATFSSITQPLFRHDVRGRRSCGLSCDDPGSGNPAGCSKRFFTDDSILW